MILDFDIPAWTEINERELLAQLASEVPVGGTILEIGCLYGGTTAVLAKNSKQQVTLFSMDNFSWTPEGYPKTSKDLFIENMNKIGADNVRVIEGDSTELWHNWLRTIDLLWIDGGHSYQYVYSDITHFGRYAKVIALHDYGNPAWESIKRAVDKFLDRNKNFYLDQVIGMVCVLRRR